MATPSMKITHNCNGIKCIKSASQYCSRCKSAHYCSVACQKSEWRAHKLLCSSFARLTEETRPSKDHFRAFSLPVGGKPEAVWLLREVHDAYDFKYQLPERERFFGPDARIRDHKIQYNWVIRRELRQPILIAHREEFTDDGSVPNVSIAAIKAVRRGDYHDWRGPLVVFGTTGVNDFAEIEDMRDLDMADFRDLCDYLVSYPRHTGF